MLLPLTILAILAATGFTVGLGIAWAALRQIDGG